MQEVIVYFIIFLVIEFFEAYWQKSDTLDQVMLKNYAIYKHSGLLAYMGLNFSLFFILYLAFALNNFSFWMSFIIILKFIDIGFKLYIFQKIDAQGEGVLKDFFPQEFSINNGLIYINIITYGSCLFMALFV